MSDNDITYAVEQTWEFTGPEDVDKRLKSVVVKLGDNNLTLNNLIRLLTRLHDDLSKEGIVDPTIVLEPNLDVQLTAAKWTRRSGVVTLEARRQNQ